MPQIIKEYREPSTSEKFGKAFSNLGQAAGQAIPEYLMAQEKKKNLSKEKEAAKRLGIDPDLDEKSRQKGIELALQGKTQNQIQAKEAALLPKMKEFADQLEHNNPDSPMHRTIADIYRSGLPMDEKSNIIKSLTGVDPFKMQQQNRLQMDSVLRRYNSRIKELRDEIKNSRFSDREPLKKQLGDLKSERDELLDFRALQGIQEEEEEIAEEEEEASKVKFNPNNKEHQAKAKQLYNKFKDKERVRQELSKEFSGL